jgi:hypothetical protein
MRLKISSTAVIGAIFIIGVATTPFIFADAPEKDACSLLTQAQVGDAVGVSFGAGTHVTQQFVKTCTWTPTASSKDVKAVTLNIQPGDTYEHGKQQLELANTAAGGGVKITSAAGIGDDAYYITTSPTITTLMFKKGTLAFKIAVYGSSSDKAMAAEKTLALEVISKL